MSRSLKFAQILAGQLRGASVIPVKRRFYRVKGRLDTNVIFASIEILVPWFFRDVKQNPPTVLCVESWMRTGAEWHNHLDEGMCWVLHPLWRDAMGWKGKSNRAIMEQGCAWLINDVRCQINRYFNAHLEGLTSWPAEWDFWSHYGKGVIEYQRENRLRRIRNASR